MMLLIVLLLICFAGCVLLLHVAVVDYCMLFVGVVCCVLFVDVVCYD